MSYYDFDDHFWAAKTVCAQSKPATSHSQAANKTVLRILFCLCIAISVGLLLKMINGIENNNTESSLTQTDNSSSNCLFLKGNAKMQVYCSQSK